MGLIFTLLAFAGVLGAQNCTFTLSASPQNFPQAGGAGTLKIVASSSSCVRMTAATVSWIVIDFGQQGTGDGSAGFTVKPDTDTPTRSGTITVGSQSITITQNGPPCNFAINPNSATVSALAQNGSFALTGLSGCSWTAASNASWLQVTSPSSGMGPAGISYAALANAATTARSGTISVAGLTFTVNQSGACVYTLSASSGSYPASGGNGTFMVSANAGCAWTATAGAGWIHITAGASGSGPGQVMFALEPNSADARSANISVAGQTFTVAQASLTCSFTLTPGSAAIPSSGGSATFSIAAPASCGWTASTAAAWITIVSGAGTGAGVVGISVAANPGDARTGNVAVGDQIFTVTQAGVGIQITLDSIANGASGAKGAVSPGLIVVITVPGIGPSSRVSEQLAADGMSFTTELARTRVLFDGVAAPMVYADNGQFSAIVPYEVAGKDSTQMQVEYQGALSNSQTIPVAASRPGVISILDQQYNLNSAFNPAARGSVVTLYATGEGQTSPAGIDGELTAEPAPTPILPVSVTIDGIDAPVLYAGAAQGFVAGFFEVSVQIPAGVQSGEREVVVRVGQAQSQPGVTVAIQ